MNYELMIANCICDTSIMQSENNTQSGGNGNEGFNSISKSILASLIDCNLDVFNCYNLVFNIKYLKNNIGFYCIIIMFIIQLICLFIYIVKKLKSLKYFMLIFKDKNLKDLSKNNNKNKEKKKNIKLTTIEDESSNEVNSKRKLHFMDDENIFKNILLSNNNKNRKKVTNGTNLIFANNFSQIINIQPPLLSTIKIVYNINNNINFKFI